MRDPLAPIVEGVDFSGFVNRYSFECEPFFIDAAESATMLDGSTVHDVFPVRARFSWKLNSLSAEQYAALNAAFDAGATRGTVSAQIFDPTINAVRSAQFHVTRPAFVFSFTARDHMSTAGSVLTLEDAAPRTLSAVTPAPRQSVATRDPLAPVIEGFDLSGLVNRWSFQCELFQTEGDNGGTLLDGSTVRDVLADKVRLSWRLNAISAQRYADLCAVLGSGSEPDTVSAIVFNPAMNTRYTTAFHVTLPVFRFAFDNGQCMAFADSSLVLEETGDEITTLVSSATITAYPNRTTFAVGDTLDYTGLVVTETYEGNVTPECTVFPVAGTPVTQAGTIVVTVSYKGESVGTFNVTVAAVVASGDWWTLFDTGLLYIYCVGDMPNLADGEWNNYADNITSVAIADCVTSIGDDAFAFDYNYYRHRIASVTLSNRTMRIGMYAFLNCVRLTRIVIPDSVTQIDYGAFYKCYNLSDISMGNGVTIIEELAFSEIHESLTSVTIPDSVTDIRERAFYDCGNLTSVVFPNKAINIERWAFVGTRLNSVTINRNSSVHEYAFPYDCVINYYD